ncbi:short-chain fatty acid transporter [Oleispirillum naphthae]|uniref:short-chain fatty acid transporter n=1 Tax=Oleispirillum naphthae TaxID=2838853 RepID=UPI003082644A
MHKITDFTVKVVQKYLPDAFILATGLTFIVFAMGIFIADKGPVQMLNFWGKGFASLFKFGMQMTLVLLTGYTLALSPVVRRILERVTDIPKTPRQALAVTALVSFIGCYFNWGFGLVIGAILAREMGRKVKGLHFPVVVAAAYGGELIRGPSSSIPLVVATPGNFMEKTIGHLIPVTDTLYSPWNLGLSVAILAALMFLYMNASPRPEDVVEFHAEETTKGDDNGRPLSSMAFAERLEHSRWVLLALAIFPVGYLIANFSSNLKFNLNLNIVILIFLSLGLLLHKSPAAFLAAVKEAIVATRGIVVQFPLYAGIAGMMGASGLVAIISQWFTAVSTPHTFPLMTFLSAGLVNIAIPSGGGQWAIQGPIMIQAAHAIGADIAQTVMAFAWGDAWTNQIQPFWALPLLGVAGLSARDIMGYCILWLALSGVLIAGTFVALSMM